MLTALRRLVKLYVVAFVGVLEGGPTEEQIEEIVWSEVAYVQWIRERVVLFLED